MKGLWRKQERKRCSRKERRCTQLCSASIAQQKNGRTVKSSSQSRKKSRFLWINAGAAAKAPGTKRFSGFLWKTGAGGVSQSMLSHLEESEDLKVGVTELNEKLEISVEGGVSIRQSAQQAMNENGQKIFEILRQGKGGMYCQFK